MLLIFLSWVYIFITATNFGILFKKSFKIQNCHIIIHQVLGLFLYAIITSFFAIVIRINVEYYLGVFVVNALVVYRYQNTFKDYLVSFIKSIRSFKFEYKLFFTFLFFVLLAQSSTKPYLLDNESYYIQTIKWINEYGYVKGLANLHMFLGQNSVWHTMQAGFNFSFVTNLFNDLNGYLFTIVGFLAVDKLNSFSANKVKSDLSFGLILAFSLFLIQFVNAPSPDLIIFLIAPYVIYLFITNYENINANDFKIVLSLVLFLCFVKVTIAIISVLVLILYLKNFKVLKKETLQYAVLCSFILFLFLAKNTIISGYLLYPTSTLDFLNVDWKQPKKLLELYELGTYLSGMNSPDVVSLNFIEKIKFWLTVPKLDGVFNKLYVLLLLIFPFVIYKRKEKFSFLTIYILALLQIVILWNNSPQYRFFFVFIIFLSIEILISVLKSKKILIFLVYLSVALSLLPLFFSVNLNTLTNNKFAMQLSEFKLKNIIVPEENTRTITKFSLETINDFEFNSPHDDEFFWSTGNGDLPCVNKNQIEFIKDYYNYMPQKRTENLKDGFRSILIIE